MIKYISPIPSRRAHGLVARVYEQIKREFGVLGEPLTLHSPIPPLLAGVWSTFRETLLTGVVRRELKEAAAVAVARLNQCPYCVDAHSVMLRAASSHAAAAAIQRGREAEIRDPAIKGMVAWASASRSPGAGSLAVPPFTRAEAPEVIGIAFWIHYINRMVTIFVGKGLIPLASNPLGLRTLSERLGGWFFAGTLRQQQSPGTSLGLLPDASLPQDLHWAATSPFVSRAFASFSAAAEEAGKTSLSAEIRACVVERVGRWQGEDPGLSLAWLEESIRGLAESSKPGARLALLAALAPHRIDEKLIGEFRRNQAADEQLLGALAWASFTAARRISSWLGAR